jgi:hypothetical protein
MRGLSILFLCLIFIIPNSFSTIKYIFIPLYLISFFYKTNKNFPFKFHKYIIYFVLFNLTFILIGFFNGANYIALFDNIKLLVVYPLTANVVLFAFSKYISFYDFQKISLFCMLIISTLGFLLFLGIIYNFQLLPENFISKLSTINDASSGTFRLNFVGLNSLFILFPISLSIFFINKMTNKSKLFFTSIIVFTFFVILLSGRRALAITSVISPFLVLSYAFFYNIIKFKKILYTLLFSFLILLTLLSYFYSVQTNFTGSDIDIIQRINSEFSDESTRVNQLPFLLNYFINHPWGSGFGVILPNSENYIRDSIYKWNFELTYLQLLCNTGIFGLLFYSTLFIFLFKKLHIIFHNYKNISIIVISTLNGLQLFLLAAFTNPYIASFDSILLILLPIYFIYNFKFFKY